MFLTSISCVQEETPLATYSTAENVAAAIDPYYGAVMVPGDIIVTNYYGDSAILLDSEGNFKKLLYNLVNNSEQVLGLNWNAVNNTVVLSINGLPDRIVEIDPLTGADTNMVISAQFNGNTFGVSVDANGNYLAVESHSVEKFNSAGYRINDADFPALNILNNGTQINTLDAGGFVLCGTGSDVVRTFDANATQIDSKASGIAATTNSYGCNETAAGNILASWDGTTDTVILYDATLTTEIAVFNNSSYMSAPRGIGVKSNGNILVADAGYHYIVELDSGLNLIRTFGGGTLSYPWQVLEVPEYADL